jgi:hypothetical protein
MSADGESAILPSSKLYRIAPENDEITKFESQYLLANTSFGGSTGLKDFDTRWDPSEWANVNTAFYHESNGVNSGTGDLKLQSDPNGTPADITNSSITDSIESERSGAITMPVAAADIDANVTGTGTLNANRIVVVVSVGTPNSAPDTPSLSSPSNAATVASTTPSFSFSATDPESDNIKYDILIHNTAATSGGNCSGSLNQENDQNSSGTGWDNGTSAYGSGTTATYTLQAGSALTRGNSYCWQVKGKDPSGSNTFGSVSSARTFTVNSVPAVPTLVSPGSNATNVSITPAIQVSSTDTDGDTLKYKIEVCSTSNCSSIVRTIDQTSSGTGWDNGTSAYSSGATATHSYQVAALNNLTQYWWRAYAVDPSGSNAWSDATGIISFTTISSAVSDKIIQGGVNITGGTSIGN